MTYRENILQLGGKAAVAANFRSYWNWCFMRLVSNVPNQIKFHHARVPLQFISCLSLPVPPCIHPPSFLYPHFSPQFPSPWENNRQIGTIEWNNDMRESLVIWAPLVIWASPGDIHDISLTIQTCLKRIMFDKESITSTNIRHKFSLRS